MAAKKPNQAKILLEQLKQRIADVKNSYEFKAWLACIAKFHKYSWRNRMLVLLQNPDATRVMGYKQWQKLGRQVRKGETGIRIVRPNPKRVEDNPDGSPKYIMYYTTTTVFDVSQTDGDPLPTLGVETQSTEGEEYIPALMAFAESKGITAKVTEGLGAYGVSRMGEIELRAGWSSDMFATFVHELAHELIHDLEKRKQNSKAQGEFEAEAVAFVVCIHTGVPTSADKYLAQYPEYDLMDSIKAISACADEILGAIMPQGTELEMAA